MAEGLAALGSVYHYEVFLEGRKVLADSKDMRITRMACHKVAVEALGPIPVTTKGELAAGWEKWKEVFVAVSDFLVDDVNRAGGLQVAPEPATVSSDTGDDQTLEEALAVATRIKESVGNNTVLKGAINLQFVRFGVKNPKSLDDAVCKLTKSQAAELEAFIAKELEQ